MAETRPPPAAAAGAGEPDPSMDDILASIRRILSEDEQANAAQGAHAPASSAGVSATGVPAAAPDEDDVLNLDDTMLVAEPTGPPRLEPARFQPPEADREDRAAMPDTETQQARLMAPEAEAATASAMGSLRRTIEARASAALAPAGARGNGPTLEDVVRDEIRPMLKGWLDANLPAMVERLVAVEIERLVARSAS